jgi:hypothetical protein
MATVTLEEFLKKDSSVQAARKRLSAAEAKVQELRSAAGSVGGRGVPASSLAGLNQRLAEAQEVAGKAKAELDKIESERTSFYNKNQPKINERATQREVSDAKQKLEEALEFKRKNPQFAGPALDNQIKDLNDKINQTGKYAPTPAQTGIDPETQTEDTVRDYAAEISNAANYLYNLSDKKRLNWAKTLNDAGYNVPLTGVFNDALVSAYQSAVSENQGRNSSIQGLNQPLEVFLIEKQGETRGIEGAQGGAGAGGLPSGTAAISTETEAAGTISSIFQREIGRLPTDAELKKFTQKLNKEEGKFSSVQRPVERIRNGVRVLEYVGGLNRDQFISELVRELPEYDQRKQAAKTLTLQDLSKTARANGLDLEKDFGDSVNTWVQRVENGEDVDVFKNLIRGTARLGMPERVAALMDGGMDLESIYAPYRRVMASTLEVNPDSISLNDPTLRMAVGPEKEMTIYDFEKNLRKDSRWQYTDGARKEVADVALKVLQDFGFMG